jgi:hypothetical protein
MKALIIPYFISQIGLDLYPPELKPNYAIPINPRKLTMAPKASSSKRAAPT